MPVGTSWVPVFTDTSKGDDDGESNATRGVLQGFKDKGPMQQFHVNERVRAVRIKQLAHGYLGVSTFCLSPPETPLPAAAPSHSVIGDDSIAASACFDPLSKSAVSAPASPSPKARSEASSTASSQLAYSEALLAAPSAAALSGPGLQSAPELQSAPGLQSAALSTYSATSAGIDIGIENGGKSAFLTEELSSRVGASETSGASAVEMTVSADRASANSATENATPADFARGARNLIQDFHIL